MDVCRLRMPVHVKPASLLLCSEGKIDLLLGTPLTRQWAANYKVWQKSAARSWNELETRMLGGYMILASMAEAAKAHVRLYLGL